MAEQDVVSALPAALPQFRKNNHRKLLLKATEQAIIVKESYQKERSSQLVAKRVVLSLEAVEKKAVNIVKENGWDSQNKKIVLGQFIHQYGQYRGKSFKWIVENDPGYVLYLCRDEDQSQTRKKRDDDVYDPVLR